ncbi:hypothetical protein CDL15_Pgr024165 [Punica granatum]|uniref:Uncharacterized protein n=1 Tax=Punica granatum TaxID=22663 RepID=A0A218XWH8_PUNGR|nr:hypothetical protein CDL15_Pgr024165 [Punica granatum]
MSSLGFESTILKFGKRVTKAVLALRMVFIVPTHACWYSRNLVSSRAIQGNNKLALPAMVAEGKYDCIEVKVSVILRDPLSRELRWDLEGNELFSLGGLNRVLIKPHKADDLMESKGGKKSSSSSKSLFYEAPLGYSIEDVRPNGGIKKFRSAAYSNVSSIVI